MIFFVAFCLILETASAGQGHQNTHSLLSRTTRLTSEENYCTRVIVRAQCPTTRCAHNYVNAITKRGTDMSTVELTCRKTERGLYCGEALAYIDGNCTGSTCTAGCSNSLMLAGCCANSGTAHQIRYVTTCNIQNCFSMQVLKPADSQHCAGSFLRLH